MKYTLSPVDVEFGAGGPGPVERPEADPDRGHVLRGVLQRSAQRHPLDTPGLERLIEHILAGGAHGLFVLGSTGEAPSLSYRLRRELVDRVCDRVAGRVPVLVGITDTSFVESVNLSAHAEKAGAAAVVLATPYYFPAGQPELLEYVRHLAPEHRAT